MTFNPLLNRVSYAVQLNIAFSHRTVCPTIVFRMTAFDAIPFRRVEMPLCSEIVCKHSFVKRNIHVLNRTFGWVVNGRLGGEWHASRFFSF